MPGRDDEVRIGVRLTAEELNRVASNVEKRLADLGKSLKQVTEPAKLNIDTRSVSTAIKDVDLLKKNLVGFSAGFGPGGSLYGAYAKSMQGLLPDPKTYLGYIQSRAFGTIPGYAGPSFRGFDYPLAPYASYLQSQIGAPIPYKGPLPSPTSDVLLKGQFLAAQEANWARTLSANAKEGLQGLRDSLKPIGEELSLIEKVGVRSMGQLAIALGAATVAGTAFYKAINLFKQEAIEGFRTVDLLRLKAASMAGAMAVADPRGNFLQYLNNANMLMEKSFYLSGRFVGSARELQILLEAMATFGVRLDLTSRKGENQFVAFANILKLITQGQNFEIQAFQEVRALMQGQNFQGAMLARRLQAAGIEVQKMVPQWVKQGTLIENIVKVLEGYQRAAGSLELTLTAQLKRLDSIHKLILKTGQEEPYQELVTRLYEFNNSLMTSEGLTKRGKMLAEGWKTVWEDIATTIRGLEVTFKAIGAAIDGIKGIVDDALFRPFRDFWAWLNGAFATLNQGRTIFEVLGFTEEDSAKAIAVWDKTIGVLKGTALKAGLGAMFGAGVFGAIGGAVGALGGGVGMIPGAIAGATLGAKVGAGFGVAAEAIQELGELDKFLDEVNITLTRFKPLEDEKPFSYYLDKLFAVDEHKWVSLTEFEQWVDAWAKNNAKAAQKAEKFLNTWKELQKEQSFSAMYGLKPVGPDLDSIIGAPVTPIPADVLDKEDEGFKSYMKRLQEFLTQQKDELKIRTLALGDEVYAKAVEAHSKIEKAFRKFGELGENKELFAKLPEATKKMFRDLREAVMSAETNLQLKEMEKRHSEGFEKLAVVGKEMGDAMYMGYDDADMKLRKKFADIDRTVRKWEKQISEGTKQMGLTVVDAFPEIEWPAELKGEVPDWVKTAQDVGDFMKSVASAGAQMEGFKDQLAYTQALEAFQLRIRAIREEAEVPVKWPWNDREVTRAELMSKATKQYANEMNKLKKEADKYKVDPKTGISPEQFEEQADALEYAYRSSMEKILEQTDFATQTAAQAWENFFQSTGEMSRTLFGDLFKGELKTLGDYFQQFTDMLLDVWANFLSQMMQEWLEQKLGDTLKSGLTSFADSLLGILGLGGGLTKGQFSSLDTYTAGLEAFYGYKHGGIIEGGFLPVRAFQHGGLVDRPTFGIIGEGGGTEAVIPLKGGKVPVDMRGGRGDTNQAININFAISAVDAKGIDRLLQEKKNLITGMIRQEIRNAGGTRDMIRRHTF